MSTNDENDPFRFAGASSTAHAGMQAVAAEKDRKTAAKKDQEAGAAAGARVKKLEAQLEGNYVAEEAAKADAQGKHEVLNTLKDEETALQKAADAQNEFDIADIEKAWANMKANKRVYKMELDQLKLNVTAAQTDFDASYSAYEGTVETTNGSHGELLEAVKHLGDQVSVNAVKVTARKGLQARADDASEVQAKEQKKKDADAAKLARIQKLQTQLGKEIAAYVDEN